MGDHAAQLRSRRTDRDKDVNQIGTEHSEAELRGCAVMAEQRPLWEPEE